MSETPRSYWPISVGAAAPALILAGLGGAMRGPVGWTLVGGAFIYLAAALLFVQPKLDDKFDRKFVVGVSLSAYARAFLQRAMGLKTAVEVARELSETAQTALGINRAMLIVGSNEGTPQVLGAAGLEATRVGKADSAWAWLAEQPGPVTRALLVSQRQNPGAKSAEELLQRLGGSVILPLKCQGLLLGAAVLGAPTRTYPAHSIQHFYKSLAATAGAALANSYLHLEESPDKGPPPVLAGLAHAIESALMPFEKPIRFENGLTVRGVFRPVSDCGGDVWAFHDLGNHRLLVFVGDATGFGIEPAVLTAIAKGCIDAVRLVQGSELDPAHLLGALNTVIYDACGKAGFTMTAFAAVIDVRAGKISFANAAQTPPYLLSKETGKPQVVPLSAEGKILGHGPQLTYTKQEKRWKRGDKLVVFTDGLAEAGDPPFGEARLVSLLSSILDLAASRLPETIMVEIEKHLGSRRATDDITIVSVGPQSADDLGGPT